MRSALRAAYSARMWGLFLEEPKQRPVVCGECAHSEFVHGDLDRHCLYSGCVCPSFRPILVVPST
jgi:hypothetical protein